MPVMRINQLQAIDGHEGSVFEFLTWILPDIQRAPGCISCEILRGLDDPTKIILLEWWESVEAHQKAVLHVDEDAMATVLALLAEPTAGEYFAE